MGFFEQIRNYIWLFSFFGLWTYWQKKTKKFRLMLRLSLAYSLLAEISSFCYAIGISYNVFMNSSLTENTANWLYIVIVWTHLIIVFESFVKSKYEAQLIDKFTLVDDLFEEKLNLSISYKKQKKQIFCRLFIVVMSIIYFKGALSAILHFYNEFFMSWYSTLYSIWIITLRSIQIVFFVYLVRTRLELINDGLKSVQNPQAIRKNLSEYTQNTSILRFIVYRRIKNLKEIYAELFEICELINKTFGWSLLTIMAQCFVDFTFNSYWSFLYLDDATPGMVSILSCASLLLPIVILSSILSFYCHTCFQESRVIERTLLRIPRDPENDMLNDLVRKFSMHVHHSKFSITANGFFHINLQLLGAMLTASVTYLVILIQFELSNKEIQNITSSMA